MARRPGGGIGSVSLGPAARWQRPGTDLPPSPRIAAQADGVILETRSPTLDLHPRTAEAATTEEASRRVIAPTRQSTEAEADSAPLLPTAVATIAEAAPRRVTAPARHSAEGEADSAPPLLPTAVEVEASMAAVEAAASVAAVAVVPTAEAAVPMAVADAASVTQFARASESHWQRWGGRPVRGRPPGRPVRVSGGFNRPIGRPIRFFRAVRRSGRCAHCQCSKWWPVQRA